MKRSAGMTLLEVMLVLAIGAAVVTLGVQQFTMYRSASDERQLLSNVDLIFAAASRYYQANCRVPSDQDGPIVSPTTGTLDPNFYTAPATVPNPFPVLMSDLRSNGYLMATLPLSPLVNNADEDTAYIVQFAQVIQDKTITGSSSSVNVGSIVLWKIQVAVQIMDPTKANTYASTLVADCVTSSSVAGQVLGCGVPPPPPPAPPAPAPLSGNYLLWERLPSYASPNASSDFWTMNPMVKQFDNMYSTFPITYLTGIDSPDTVQNYLCGS